MHTTHIKTYQYVTTAAATALKQEDKAPDEKAGAKCSDNQNTAASEKSLAKSVNTNIQKTFQM